MKKRWTVLALILILCISLAPMATAAAEPPFSQAAYDALTRGDFSAFAGVWKNGKDSALTLNSDGGVLWGAMAKQPATASKVSKQSGGWYHWSAQEKDYGGFSVSLIPVGVADPFELDSDTSKTRMLCGQGYPESLSEIFYFSHINVSPASTSFMLGGKEVSLPAYSIGGSSYVKLRDVAALLIDRFDVRYEAGKATLYNHEPYTVVGGELAALSSGAQEATVSDTAFFMGSAGAPVEGLSAYLINGSNYIKLRDIAKALDFNVDWRDGKAWIEPENPYTAD